MVMAQTFDPGLGGLLGEKIVKLVSCLLPFALSGCVAAVPLAVGGTCMVGTAAMEERGIDGAVSDQSIRGRINYEWANSPLDFTGIETTVYNGKVLLTGPVHDAQAQAEAVRLARVAPGVREVIDATKLGGKDNYFADAWITTKLRSNILADRRVAAHNFTIRTYDGIVYLMGTALDQDDLDALLENAADVTGVRNVVSFVEIKEHIPTPYYEHENVMYQQSPAGEVSASEETDQR